MHSLMTRVRYGNRSTPNKRSFVKSISKDKQLLNHNPVVRNYLIDLEIAASQKDAVSLEDHLSTLHDLREEAKDQGQISAAITAEVHRGKAGGLYIDRREILTAKIDMMSKDDLLTRLEDLIKKRVVEGRIVEQG